MMMNERTEIMREQPEENQTMTEDAPPIEGGLIIQAEKDLSFHKEKHHADTTRRLAYWLVIVLGGSIVIHYATVLVLEMYGYHKAVESLEKIFNSWLPVISGLVGAATTYYFTKGK
jgi:hypothetical protein